MMMFAYIFDYGSSCGEYSGSEVQTRSLYNLYQGGVRQGDFVYQGACPAGGVGDGNRPLFTGSGTYYQRYQYDFPQPSQNATMLLL